MSENFSAFLYLTAAVFFILALRGLSSAKTSIKGNVFGIIGMGVAIVAAFAMPKVSSYALTITGIIVGGAIGALVAKKIDMTALPQLVAAFHSLVGLAAVLVAAGAMSAPISFKIGTLGHIMRGSLVEIGLGTAIGAVTFTGSVVAFLKLQGLIGSKPLMLPNRHLINVSLGALILFALVLFVFTEGHFFFWVLASASFALGLLMILPVGGADMPVIVSMLNSYSGWAASGIGFTLNNTLLIVTGALVGASGAILSYIMCKAMNRSIINVIVGGFGNSDAFEDKAGSADEQRSVKQGSPEDAAFVMKNCSSLVIVPGYGMAVAQAQHALREMCNILKNNGVKVRYAIHPVAGRMPGHMNVLLAEANVPYDDVLELEDINRDFPSTDVAFVIGANDVTNPAAKNNPQSPIYGMPILEVEQAKTVFFIKRSMAAGYAGIDNELFFRDNTMMLFGDAKKVTEEIVKALES
ncbi:MAG: NAD(P)(+) transhydrogenase (Re/Si-specific) subunit beta [Holosporales bacterium]|jgi:NAD(P) transhydrogenase subunit beta|nr:NAD(P)(+) transhydrogenase (Re/Si-specific) subunit beta [Holosporales bacterium]